MESPEASYRDPYDWSVDEVVEQFCHNQRPVWSNEVKLNRALKSQNLLESALRDNDIDGVNLFELTDVSLKQDLGLTSFGQRGDFLRVINFLRLNSKKLERDRFQSEAINRHLNDSRPQFTPQATSTYQPDRNSNPQYGGFGQSGHFQLPQLARSHYTTPQQHIDQRSNAPITIDAFERSVDLTGFSNQKSPSEQDEELHRTKKRRLAPIHIGDVIERTSRILNTDEAAKQSVATEAYLGRGALSLDDVFSPTGVDDSMSLNISNSYQPPGLRQATSSALLGYLRQSVQVQIDTHINHRSQQRRSRQRKDFILPEHDTVDDNPFLVTEQSMREDPNFDALLQKYPVDDDPINLLPLFGDSDDEVDSETWEEVQQEIAEKQQIRHSQLSQTDLINTINAVIIEQQLQWFNISASKVDRKAYRAWRTSAKHNSRESDIAMHEFWITKLDQRIDKQKQAILKDIWRRVDDVRKQCESLEPSVSQREEHKHLVLVLQNVEPPPRPPPAEGSRIQKSRPKDLGSDEEDLDSDSETSIAEFIANDALESSDIESIPHGAMSLNSNASQEPEKHAAGLSSPKSRKSSPSVSRFFRGRSQKQQEAIMASDSDDQVISSARLRHAKPTLPSSHGVAPKSDTDREDSSEQDSDLDRQYLPKTEHRHRGTSESKPIDLTLSDSPSRIDSDDRSVADFQIRTPELNPTRESSPRRRIVLKVSDETTSTPVRLSKERSRGSTPEAMLIRDMQAVLDLDWDVVELDANRQLALVKAVYEMDLEHAKQLRIDVQRWDIDRSKAKSSLQHRLLRLHNQVPSYKTLRMTPGVIFPLLFLTYIHCLNLIEINEVSKSHLDEAYEEIDNGFKEFFSTLLMALNTLMSHNTPKRGCKGKLLNELTDDGSASDSEIVDFDSETEEKAPPSSHKKRKRVVQESQQAKVLQQSDQARVQEREQRKLQMKQQLSDRGTYVSHIINTRQPYIELHRHIGDRVKPHQVEGISFMWREIIEDPKQQGCLLAHTMGLGKTMQVLSLLYTINECGQSEKLAIQQQIPESLREVKALILCPPSLAKNWIQEYHLWVPYDSDLGEIYSMAETKNRLARLALTRKWAKKGGILIVGYEMLRGLLTPSSKTAPGSSKEAVRLEFEELLLNSPNIVVADEAHKIKSPTSQIGTLSKRFKTLSRIALTGSPLNNRLEEYYTMIDWIAPGYLGNMVQFKAKYSEPIMQGLFVDSTNYEKRLSLRKLTVFKRDIDPKVNRADISAIANDIPTKTEFFIQVPLTELQLEAYNIIVQHALECTWSGPGKMTTLWAAISLLRLICLHPGCFIDKVQSDLNAAVKANLISRAATPTSDYEVVVPEPEDENALIDVLSPDSIHAQEHDSTKAGLSDTMLRRAMDVFSHLKDSGVLYDPDASFRMDLVVRIIQKSTGIGDKVLVFSHRIPALDYLGKLLDSINCQYMRLDGSTAMHKRQGMTKDFNDRNTQVQVFLISIQAGGLGINLQGANRVIILDFDYNPTWEEQAIGRAYRFGQTRPVYVYRFRSGITFENTMYNKSIFKTNLFQRVIDRKNYKGLAEKSVSEWVFAATEPEQEDLAECIGKDPRVFDKILEEIEYIRQVQLTETFQKEDDQQLNEDERKLAEQEYQDEVLLRENPAAHLMLMQTRSRRQAHLQNEQSRATASWVQSTHTHTSDSSNRTMAATSLLKRPLDTTLIDEQIESLYGTVSPNPIAQKQSDTARSLAGNPKVPNHISRRPSVDMTVFGNPNLPSASDQLAHSRFSSVPPGAWS